MTTRNLQSIKDFAARGPFSESQLRFYVFHAQQNGLAESGAVVRVGGRRVYIDVDGFDRWLVAQNPSLAPAIHRRVQA